MHEFVRKVFFTRMGPFWCTNLNILNNGGIWQRRLAIIAHMSDSTTVKYLSGKRLASKDFDSHWSVADDGHVSSFIIRTIIIFWPKLLQKNFCFWAGWYFYAIFCRNMVQAVCCYPTCLIWLIHFSVVPLTFSKFVDSRLFFFTDDTCNFHFPQRHTLLLNVGPELVHTVGLTPWWHHYFVTRFQIVVPSPHDYPEHQRHPNSKSEPSERASYWSGTFPENICLKSDIAVLRKSEIESKASEIIRENCAWNWLFF